MRILYIDLRGGDITYYARRLSSTGARIKKLYVVQEGPIVDITQVMFAIGLSTIYVDTKQRPLGVAVLCPFLYIINDIETSSGIPMYH